jgi:hypothetical protein
VYTQDGERKLMVAALRYRDAFVKRAGAWVFACPRCPSRRRATR